MIVNYRTMGIVNKTPFGKAVRLEADIKLAEGIMDNCFVQKVIGKSTLYYPISGITCALMPDTVKIEVEINLGISSRVNTTNFRMTYSEGKWFILHK